jgi:hypothetical protein
MLLHLQQWGKQNVHGDEFLKDLWSPFAGNMDSLVFKAALAPTKEEFADT